MRCRKQKAMTYIAQYLDRLRHLDPKIEHLSRLLIILIELKIKFFKFDSNHFMKKIIKFINILNSVSIGT